MSAAMLEARDICKRYGALRANDGVSLTARAGEIHALIGENGAGKSTLVNILYGITQADSGEVRWRGAPTVIKNPAHARALGIGVVFQKFSLFEPLTVMENIRLAVTMPPAELAAALRRLADDYRLRMDLQRRVESLSAGEKQRLEIIRCLLQKPALLIMDEPTSVLTPAEAEQLFALLRALAASGCAILFISHKLNEVEALCERVTVLRRGRTVAQSALADKKRSDLIELMVGEGLAGDGRLQRARSAAAPDAPAAAPLLQLRALRVALPDAQLDIESLALKSGCVTGIAGIAGNGQEALVQCISGELTSAPGSALLDGQPIGDWGVRQRARAGILSAPTDRYHTAAAGALPLADNVLLGCMRREQYISRGLLQPAKMRETAARIIADYKVAAPSAQTPAQALSGGNLQKFILGRAIMQKPRVLAAANPTWGVDVQSALFIRRALRALAEDGAAVLVASEDLDELFEIADEIAVINSGRLTPPLPVTDDLTAAAIGAQMAQG